MCEELYGPAWVVRNTLQKSIRGKEKIKHMEHHRVVETARVVE